jgi:spermidine/putrescine transport system substrate-binding protein
MKKALTLLTWPDYISPQTLLGFEAEFGVKVELKLVPSAVELIERMQASSSGIDVLVPPDYAVRELGALGLLLKLDPSQLPNLDHLDLRFFRGRAHDPESRVSVIKDWGTTGFLYRTDMIDEILESWADFWRLSKKMSGRVTVLDSPGEVIGAALKLRGHSYNSSSLEQLADAHAEGSQLWEDDWAIAADAPHSDLAHAFLNFVLGPEIAAQEALYTRYATGNQSARALLDEKLRDDPSTYPPANLLAQLEYGMPIDPAGQKRREQLWREVRG